METGKQFTTIAALSNALTTRETRRRLGGRLFCSVLFGSGSIAISTDVHFLIITLCSQSQRERERDRQLYCSARLYLVSVVVVVVKGLRK